MARFFSPSAVFRHSLRISDVEDMNDKQYEIFYPAIARYFHTHFHSGVKSMQLILDSGVTDRPLPGDCYCIENSKASLVYWFETGSHVRPLIVTASTTYLYDDANDPSFIARCHRHTACAI